MLQSRTNPESYITEYTSVYEEKFLVGVEWTNLMRLTVDEPSVNRFYGPVFQRNEDVDAICQQMAPPGPTATSPQMLGADPMRSR